ncbi:MAG TPA: hypothetical protein VGU71_02145 [Candidatus Dormibacteraeota bacterium]|nr:hypothetical protein [Candidatus Dormibacteraeota bacterium]
MTALRWGLFFGVCIAAANLVLQFIVTPFVPWQLVGALSVGAWLAGLAAAGVFAGVRSLRTGASAAAIAAAVDLVRNATMAIVVGVPAAPTSTLQGSPTPGMIIAGTIVEFLVLIGPIAAGVGLAAAYVSRRSPAPRTVTGD